MLTGIPLWFAISPPLAGDRPRRAGEWRRRGRGPWRGACRTTEPPDRGDRDLGDVPFGASPEPGSVRRQSASHPKSVVVAGGGVVVGDDGGEIEAESPEVVDAAAYSLA